MLQIKNISKQYITGDLVQNALDDVSLNLRDNEFVAILGPSGSGKTTLLNIIGGLDHYDSGDLIINNVSTKKYKSRDWDAYRNHTIGFVFQSYNLIPHQTILANVELALTIAGISRKERRRRAKNALDEVGLKGQYHKKPNQMSGGQMQRVAIARALVNNPDILLADEPTGALDTETSVQVMELLKKVANDRLVVMVTHNPELAELYATRTVKLQDGKILGDSDPYEIDDSTLEPPKHKKLGKASMSPVTSFFLSLNNLGTKKARTILTSFAGSIGIIGIALILSISTGVNTYINDIQKSTMASYPITIDAQTYDLSSLMQTGSENTKKEIDHDSDSIYSNNMGMTMASAASVSMTENNLTDFKAFLDKEDNEIHDYVGENGIVYSYDVSFEVYTYDITDTLINTDGVTIDESGVTLSESSSTSITDRMTMMSSMMGNYGIFEELIPGVGDELISPALKSSYDVVYGSWPTEYNEFVLVLDSNNEIPLQYLYQLGFLEGAEYEDILDRINNGEKIEFDSEKFNYNVIDNKEYYLIPACDWYTENEDGTFSLIENNRDNVIKLIENSIGMKISGIIRPAEDSDSQLINKSIAFTSALTKYLIDYTDNSAVVKAQLADPSVNVLNGLTFEPIDDNAKAEDARTFLTSLNTSEKASVYQLMMSQSGDQSSMMALGQMTEAQMADMLDATINNEQIFSVETLISIYDKYVSQGTYDENMKSFGVVSLDAPSSISLYADSFENKDNISTCIEKYNEEVSEENQITYTDYVGLLMSSVTTIVNVITYVLVAFVAVSLVVSSIMIGIITYISVLERTKEIGILRALGASKGNISQVFNAETFIIGLFSGIIGVGLTIILNIPINAVIHHLSGNYNVNAQLPIISGIILVLLSIILTLIGGLIPSKKAAKKDPVTALRTD